MIESSKHKLPMQRSIPSFRKFPLLQTIQQLHHHNLRVAEVCRQSSMHSLNKYDSKKHDYYQKIAPSHEQHLRNAESLQRQKRKSLQEKNRSRQKKYMDNISRLEKAVAQKRNKMALKEQQLMQKSQIRRQEYIKSLHDSFHVSHDKLYKIRQREQNQMRMSRTLFTSFEQRVQAANQRKEQNIQELRALLNEKNSQVCLAQAFCSQQNKKKEDEYIKRLVLKYQKLEMSSAQKQQKIEEWLEEKRMDDVKLYEKNLKKRTMLQDLKDKARQQQHRKSQEKQEKAVSSKKAFLNTISATLLGKRKDKENDIFNATLSSLKQRDDLVENLNEKHRVSKYNWQSYKQEKERLHGQFLAESYLLSHQE